MSHNIYFKHHHHSTQTPVSLNEVKNFLNIEEDFLEQDNLLHNLLNIATEYAEWYTEKSLMQREWNMVCVGQIPSKLYLLYGPIIKVTKITCENNPIFSEENYHIENIGGYIEFYNLHYDIKINIDYIAGHTSTDDIPETIKEGILHHISAVYHKRNDTNYITHIKKLYEQFREVRLTL